MIAGQKIFQQHMAAPKPCLWRFDREGNDRPRLAEDGVPGMSVRIADAGDPWGASPLPPGQAGLLLVRGPNIMQGYIGQPKLTAEVLHQGWYCTGDMAMRDEDGFLQITGRLSRFSKIGGEDRGNVERTGRRRGADVCGHRRAG